MRDAYLGGMSARECAAVFDVGEGALRRRARLGGWRRRDLPDVPPTLEGSITSDEAGVIPVDGRTAARAAMDHAVILIRKGQFTRAAEAMKAAELMGRVAERLPDPAVETETDAAAIEALHRKIAALCVSVGDDVS